MNQYIQNSNKLKEAIKKRLIIAKNEIDDAEIESEKNILDEFINLSVDNIYQTINLIINSSVDRIFHQAVIDRIIENRDIGLNQYSISIRRPVVRPRDDGLAVGPANTASGRALLFINPHTDRKSVV